MLENEINSAPILDDSIVLARWIFSHIDAMTPDDLAQVLDRLGEAQQTAQAHGEVPQWAMSSASGQ